MHHHHHHHHRSFVTTGSYYRSYKKDDKAKKVFKILGPVLLVPGVILIVLGILGFVGVFSLGVGIVCIDFGSFAFLPGLIFTIMGWSKAAVYSSTGGHFEEIPVTVTVGNSAITCASCGTANSDDSLFCKKCGKPIKVITACPHCNAKVDKDSKFCTKCGRPISDNGKPAEASETKPKEKVERADDTQADYNKARDFYNRGEYAEAFKLFKILAERGDAGGQNGLGSCYNNGYGVKQDPYEAIKWFKKAADQGFAKAYYNLGVCYAQGNGVPVDHAEAIKWFKKAKSAGMIEAVSPLRMLGYRGQDEALSDLSSALDNMHQALSQLKEIEVAPVPKEESQPQPPTQTTTPTEQIDAEAEYDLGYRYFNGIGVEMNRDEAFKCYLRAAEQGHKRAMYKVGDCYYFGHGVERDPYEATDWYRKANAAK